MKVLVIPDVHLKPWIFERASELLKETKADRAVCLGDIPDDWRQEANLDLYINTFDSAIGFAKEHPETLWCYGNHDICYLWDQDETGYSPIAHSTVCEKLRVLQQTLPDKRQLAFIHRIDNVIFCHGGLAEGYVKAHFTTDQYDDIDYVIETINGFGADKMWNDFSPIWFRPQYINIRLYKSDELLQVVGHTPSISIAKEGNLISCDVFSLTKRRIPFGSQEFLLLDTVSWEFGGVT